MTTSEQAIAKFPCPSCGANLAFNPQSGGLKCPYCGWQDAAIQSTEPVEERSYEDYFEKNQTRFGVLSSTALAVQCSECGADITFEPPQVAGQCPFCATHIVAQPKQADPTLAPEGIVPFQIDRKAARESIRRWLERLWWAPRALKKLAQLEKIQGVYLPFWIYDARTRSHYRGERGDYYYVTETYTETNAEGETETKTRQVQRTRWTSVSGRVSRSFDDLAIAATQLIDLKRLERLEPWHLQESVRPYHASYLAGFKAQRAQVTLKEGFERAKALMSGQIRSDVRGDIGGDEQRIHNISTAYHDITFKHVLLPVWLASYCYRNKYYQVIVNARTGEVQGDRPYSILQIASAIAAGIAIVVGGYLAWQVDWQKTFAPRESSPIESPAPSTGTPNPAPQEDVTFQQGLNFATRAATFAQTAQTPQEWQTVVRQWQEAIVFMEAVPPASPNYEIAQNKVVEYRRYLDYARQRVEGSSN
jgi:DNA-directed RNA polymerase subunit RPC12/RpoP